MYHGYSSLFAYSYFKFVILNRFYHFVLTYYLL